jgi:putative peptidoglycan binding protein
MHRQLEEDIMQRSTTPTALQSLKFVAAVLAVTVVLAGASPSLVAVAQTPAPSASVLSEATVKALQEALTRQGIAVKADGVLTDETRAAIRTYQSQHHLPVTGEPDAATLGKLGVRQGAAPAQAPTLAQAATPPAGSPPAQAQTPTPQAPQAPTQPGQMQGGMMMNCPMMQGMQGMMHGQMMQMMQGMMQMMQTMQAQMQTMQGQMQMMQGQAPGQTSPGQMPPRQMPPAQMQPGTR